MPKMKRPLAMWSTSATSAATIAGWWLGRLTVPVPSRIRLVSRSSQAMKIRADAMFSAASVTCSPMKPSVKPSSLGEQHQLPVLLERHGQLAARADGWAW